jgi:hypothetical protein
MAIFDTKPYSEIRRRVFITVLIMPKRCLIGFLIAILSYWNTTAAAADQKATITENECVRLQTAEVVWDLSIYRWRCCIPKNKDEYETCIPISDMEPLPKTSLKPFPPNTTQTIKP